MVRSLALNLIGVKNPIMLRRMHNFMNATIGYRWGRSGVNEDFDVTG